MTMSSEMASAKPCKAASRAGVRAEAADSGRPATLLLVLPVPMRRIGSAIHIESQAAHGLARWADNFPRVVAALVHYPEALAARLSGVKWERIDGRPDLGTVEIIPLPHGYGLLKHVAQLREVRRLLLPRIEHSDYLCFAIGGCFGDWGSVAASLAASRGRSFAVWADRVESQVIRRHAEGKKSWLRRLKGSAYARLVGIYERGIIAKATLGLFNGEDTYAAYKDKVGRAFPVRDIHLSTRDRLPEAEILRLKDGASGPAGGALRIGYAGRAADMKAPLDWLRALHRLAEKGIAFEATWLGDGPLLEAMRRFVRAHGLEARIRLGGFVADREQVLAAIRQWDVLLFTHVTPESPRILLEAMVSATPLVGYDSLYARSLVKGFGEDYLVPVGGQSELAERLAKLALDRQELRRLAILSYRSSAGFNDVSVFRQRSDLIKTYL